MQWVEIVETLCRWMDATSLTCMVWSNNWCVLLLVKSLAKSCWAASFGTSRNFQHGVLDCRVKFQRNLKHDF